MIHPVIFNPIINPLMRVLAPVQWEAGKAGHPDGAILHWDASLGFVDQTGNQQAVLIGDAYPTVTAGYAANASGAEWGFSTDSGPARTALLAGEVTLVQVVTLPLMSTLTDATDYSLFGDLLFVRRDGTAGSFKVSDGANTATVAYDWSEGESVTVSCGSHLGALSVNVGVSKPPYDVETARIGGVIYVGHRGAPLLYPEASLSGYRRITADGCRAIEMDVRLTSDGVPVVMHDETVDRTCVETGLVTSYTAAQWDGLHIDAGAGIGGEWATHTEPPPTWEQVVSEFGGKYLLLPEVKTGAVKQPLVDVLIAHSVPLDMAIVQSFDLNSLVPAKDAGYKTMYLGTAETPSALATAGVDYVCVHSATVTGAAFVATYTDLGIGVGAYGVETFSRARTLESYGVFLIMSDDIQRVSPTKKPELLSEDFLNHKRRSGYTPAISKLIDGYYPISGAFNSQVMGALCPVRGETASDRYVIDVDYVFTSVTSDNRWIAIDICASDIAPTGSTTMPTPGFRFIFRRGGALQIYHVGTSVSTLLVESVYAPAALGALVSARITILPGSLSFERTDISGTPATVADSRDKGGFVFVSSDGVNGRVEKISISFTAPLPLSAQPCKGHTLPIGVGKITIFPGVASASQIEEAK